MIINIKCTNLEALARNVLEKKTCYCGQMWWKKTMRMYWQFGNQPLFA